MSASSPGAPGPESASSSPTGATTARASLAAFTIASRCTSEPTRCFRDINDLEPGRPWEEAIDGALDSCDVFVLLIGPRWLDATDDEGNRRIDDPGDRHRREIETAIKPPDQDLRRAHGGRAHAAPASNCRRPPTGSEGLQKVPGLHALRMPITRSTTASKPRDIERAAQQASAEGDALITNIERAAEQAGAERQPPPAEPATAERRPQEPQPQVEVAERPRTDEEPRARTRRTRTIAGLVVGALIVVAVILLVSSGDDGDDGDTATAVGSAIGVGGQPVDVAFGEGGVWVTNRDEKSVSLIADGDPAAVTVTVDLDHAPEGVTVGGGSVWVAKPGPSRVWQISPDGDVLDEIRVGGTPADLAIDAQALWVANSGSNSVSRLAPEGADTIEVGGEPYGVAIGAEAVWVTNRIGDSVSRIPDDVWTSPTSRSPSATTRRGSPSATKPSGSRTPGTAPCRGST